MSDLKTLNVEKRPTGVRLSGRILFLTEDPTLLTTQLAGNDLDWNASIKLRDDISTDEITPAYICYYFDETLGDFPYLGLKAGGQFPCQRGLAQAMPAPIRTNSAAELTRNVKPKSTPVMTGDQTRRRASTLRAHDRGGWVGDVSSGRRPNILA